MLAAAEFVAFVATRDLERAGRFYGDLLGLELIESSPFSNVYDARGTRLRVTLVDDLVLAPYTVAGWRVGDIASTMRELRAAGVTFRRYEGMAQDHDDVWTAPSGARIAWFADPDDNTLSLEQPA
jgi:catechol 2,3-dioxygenase-like lactoylglutathione lyase family enzyme